MSASHRPFGQPRLGLEFLEAREVPAIVCVGGWESSLYQSATPDYPNVVDLGGSTRSDGSEGRVTGVAVDPSEPPSPAASHDFLLDIQGVYAEPSTAADYSAIAFVGGWVSSMYQYAFNDPVAAAGEGPGSLGIEVNPLRHESLAENAVAIESLNIMIGGLTSEQGANTSPVPLGRLLLGTDAGGSPFDAGENLDTADVGTAGGGLQARQTTVVREI